MGLVGGVVALNVVFTAVGYCLLAPALSGRGALVRITYAGVALLVGTAAVGVALCFVVPFGVRIGFVAFGAVAAILAAAGLLLARVRAARAVVDAEPRAVVGPARGWSSAIATLAGAALVAVLVIALVGGFRSSPWLDDTWYFWLPKGRALDLVGLDPRLWQPRPDLHMVFGQDYETLTFIRPDNPLWWSIVLDLDVRFVGSIDLRAVNGELAFLLIGFAAAAARLLWGWVRPAVLLPVLLVVVAAPELLRQAQGGDADVPLAIFLSLGLLCAVGWLAVRSGFALALFGLFAASAIGIKSEGILELLLYLAVLSAAAWRVRRALPALWLAAGAAIVTSVPWFVWRASHGISNVFSLHNAVSPAYLGDHTRLLHGAARILREHLTSVHEWSLIVPLTLAAGIAAAVRTRSAAYLAPAVILVVAYALFVWISWADPDGAFRLLASAYRYVTPPILVAGVLLPVLVEHVVAPPGRGR